MFGGLLAIVLRACLRLPNGTVGLAWKFFSDNTVLAAMA